MSFLDFLHPLWRKGYKKPIKDQEKSQKLNDLVLDVFDKQLEEVKQDTIAAKIQSFLGEATDEWLDYWGDWFGLKRQYGQDDATYRQAIINHVKHPRNTIPALRTAISKFLHTNIKNVFIYEPWNDILILNDDYTRLNQAHLYGDYYHPAVIDIHIAVPFPPEVIDIINWFRPAGVVFKLTSDYGMGDAAPIWKAPSYYLHEFARLSLLTQMTGFTKHQNLFLTPATTRGSLSDMFILNDSKLNSKALLQAMTKDYQFGYLGYVGYLNALLTPTDMDSPETFSYRMNTINQQDSQKLAYHDGDKVVFTVTNKPKANNLLKDTSNWTNWRLKDAYVDLADTYYQGQKIVHLLSANASVMANQNPVLESGKPYTLSFFIKSKNPTVKNEVKVAVTIDLAHTAVVVANQLSTDWQQVTYHFAYTDTLVLPFNLQLTGTFSKENEVSIAGICLEAGDITKPIYTKSMLDYGVDALDTHYHYTYGAFNVKDFYFDNYESEGVVRSKLPADASAQDINKYITDNLDHLDFINHYAVGNIYGNVHSQVMFYNFHLKLWVRYQDDNILDHDINMNLSLDKFSAYLNAKGMLVVAIQTDTQPHDYQLIFDDLALGLDKIDESKEPVVDFSIGDIKTFQTLKIISGWSFVDNGGVYDRYETHYPIRYIRNTIKDVHFYNNWDGRKKPFKLNYSGLNGQDYLTDAQDQTSKVLDNFYTRFNIVPKHNPYDKRIPVASLSILGAYAGDNQHKNLLGNLLPNGIFADSLCNAWQFSGNEDSLQLTDSQDNNILGYHLQGNVVDKNQGWTIFSENTYKESSYNFTFNTRSYMGTTNLRVKVYLHTNDYKELVVDKLYKVGFNTINPKVTFDTNVVFADHIEIQVLLDDLRECSLDFGNTDLRLATKLYVDDKQVDHNVPDIVPLSFPQLYNDPEQRPLIIDKDKLVGKVTYDDIQFDNNLSPILFSDGLRPDVTYNDELVKTLTYKDILPQADAEIDYVVNLAKYLETKHELTDDLKALLTSYHDAIEAIKANPVTTESIDKLLLYSDTLRKVLRGSNPTIAESFETAYQKRLTYLNALGFRANRNRHTVTIDLGRVYNNIESLYVHHGSDSDELAQYDSLLETSVDGINWVPWYDNFAKTKPVLDDYYIEAKGKPKEIKIADFNELQGFRDYNGPQNPNVLYMSAVAERYPAYDVVKKIFGLDVADKDLLTIHYQEKTTSDKPSIDDNVKPPYNPWTTTTTMIPDLPEEPLTTVKDKVKHSWLLLNQSSLNGVACIKGISEQILSTTTTTSSTTTTSTTNTTTTTREPHEFLLNKDSLLNSQDFIVWGYLDTKPIPSITTTSTTYKVTTTTTTKFDPHRQRTIFRLNQSLINYDLIAEAKAKLTTTTTSTTQTTVSISTTTTTIPDYNQDRLFILNSKDSPLNGKKVLMDSRYVEVEKPGKPVVPDKPTDVPKDKVLVQKQLTFDVVSAVAERYPKLFAILKLDTRAKQAAFVKDYLLGAKAADNVWFSVQAQFEAGWYMALWNTDTHRWEDVTLTQVPVLRTLQISKTDLMTTLDAEGYSYVLIYAYADEASKVPTLAIKDGSMTFAVYPKQTNDFPNSLYPHQNQALQTQFPKTYIGHNQVNESAWLYELDPAVLGHKVRLSFNLASNTSIGMIGLYSPNITLDNQMLRPIARNNQHYSVILNLPKTAKGNPIIGLRLNKLLGKVTVYAFKVELGADETPYVLPALKNS